MSAPAALETELILRRPGGGAIGRQRVALLDEIARRGSIAKAAKALGLSYKGAWDAVQALNALFDRPLVTAHPGGGAGAGAELTLLGVQVLQVHRRLEQETEDAMRRLEDAADNLFSGQVTRVSDGEAKVEVELTLAPGLVLVAQVSRRQWDDLALAPGDRAHAWIAAADVMLALGAPGRVSARNQLGGVVAELRPGQEIDEVALSLAPGLALRVLVTGESRKVLDLRPGALVTALVKAGHVALAR